MLTADERRRLFASIDRYLWAMRTAFPPGCRARARARPDRLAPHCPICGALLLRPRCRICDWGRDRKEQPA